MGRKNLYISDEHEPVVERLEKALERRGQSLSDFFMQSVKNAVPAPARARSVGTAKGPTVNGMDCALAVDAAWRHSAAVNTIIGPPDNPKAKSSDSSMIVAKVLSTDDALGLWIEVNSEQKRNPGFPILQFAIPWRFLLGVCVDPMDASSGAAQPEKRYGFAPDGDLTIHALARELTAGATVAFDAEAKSEARKQKREK